MHLQQIKLDQNSMPKLLHPLLNINWLLPQDYGETGIGQDVYCPSGCWACFQKLFCYKYHLFILWCKTQQGYPYARNTTVSMLPRVSRVKMQQNLNLCPQFQPGEVNTHPTMTSRTLTVDMHTTQWQVPYICLLLNPIWISLHANKLNTCVFNNQSHSIFPPSTS